VLAPGGKDAADILLAGGKTELETALAGGLSEVEFRLNAALEKFSPHTLDGKRNILQMLLPRLRPQHVFDPVALELQRLVIDRLMLEQKMLETYLNQNRPKQTAPRLDDVQMRGMARSHGGDEVKLAKILIQNPALIAKLDGEAAFESPLVAEVIFVARTASSTEQILEHFRGRPEAAMLLEGLFVPNRTTNHAFIPSGMDAEKADVAANQITSRQREEKLRLELADLKAQIPKAPLEQQIVLARQCSEVQKAIEAERRLRIR
jgi:DNA primase